LEGGRVCRKVSYPGVRSLSSKGKEGNEFRLGLNLRSAGPHCDYSTYGYTLEERRGEEEKRGRLALKSAREEKLQ
jgi:hypothetical protein